MSLSELIPFPLYFEWVISSMYPLQAPYLPFYGSTYFKSIDNIYKFEREVEYGMNLIETKTNEPSTNPWDKLGTATLTITPFIVVYFAAGNLGYEIPSWLWEWLK